MKRLIIRFENKDNLDEFISHSGLNNITRYTKEYNYSEKKNIERKVVAKKIPKEEYWKKHWVGLPEYVSEKQEPYAQIDFLFDDDEKFLSTTKNLFKQNVTDKTTSLWFPKLNAGWYSTLRVVGGNSINKYPIYTISKGRHDRCYTSRFLSQMEVRHYVVVEPQEVDLYNQNLDLNYATVLALDMKYKDEYDTFDDLGYIKSKGPGAARNFCWEHSIVNGFEWHWVMDDNTTEGFHYMNNNVKQKVRTGTIFRAMEDFVDRYENIAIAGMNYSKFCKMQDKTPAFVMNTRIYSYLLIRNNIPYRWRGRYNEDTDLSLRVLKDGWCTVQFNTFLAGKVTTQVVKGGNTEEFYAHEGTLPKSKMIEDMHPDVAKVVWKFNRWHHQVDYSGFNQRLKLKSGTVIRNGVDNYGMVVIDTEEHETTDYKTYLENKYSKLLN